MTKEKTLNHAQLQALKNAYGIISEGNLENISHLEQLINEHPFLIKYHVHQKYTNIKHTDFIFPPSLIISAIQLAKVKEKESYAYIDLLLEKGAKINMPQTHYKKGFGFSPLTFTNNINMMNYLMQKGAKYAEKEYIDRLKVINQLNDGSLKNELLKTLAHYNAYQEKLHLDNAIENQTIKKKIKM